MTTVTAAVKLYCLWH